MVYNTRRRIKFRNQVVVLIFLILLYLFLQIINFEITEINRDYIASSVKRHTKPKLITGFGNFEPKHIERREGPGENGIPHVLRLDQRKSAKHSELEFGMNIACSDEISLDRSVPDTRLEECKHWDYPTDLPSASVVIVFHSESWSVLLRTLHSVINRSPHHILKEILLVDDFSNKEYLRLKLDNYISRFNGKVRIIRNSKCEGLIKTKSRAAEEATGEVLVFLDGHCEVNTNWLLPLLAPIYIDKMVLTVPIIDKIDHKTFEYKSIYPENHPHRGIFDWGMQYKEKEIPRRELYSRTYKSEPYKSPTYAGDLFAIDREYFLSIGGYDPGLLISGGENLELSFKIWQCGGSIKWIPCSRVGHVSHHTFIPYKFDKLNKENLPFQTINYKRIIETWLDNKYKEYFYTRIPNARLLDIGAITDQLRFKKMMHCKNFQWYMKNVAYDVFDKFPEPPPNHLWGLFCTWDIRYCMNFFATNHQIQIKNYQKFNNNQIVRLNTRGQLAVGEYCIEADSEGVKLVKCHPGSVGGPWKFNNKTIMLHHIYQKKCMAFEQRTKELSLLPCDKSDILQKWVFKTQYEISTSGRVLASTIFQ